VGYDIGLYLRHAGWLMVKAAVTYVKDGETRLASKVEVTSAAAK
jgi:hypothetical protein